MPLDEDLSLGPPSEEALELRKINQGLQRQLKEAKARSAALIEAVEQGAREAAITVGRPAIPTPPRDGRKKSVEVALVHATDWQGGKRTESFDITILGKRISILADKVARITDIQRADHPVKECTLLVGGDMVEGLSIFPGQAFEVDSTLFDQLFTVALILEQLITDLLQIFEKVNIICEYGNHGRIGRRGDLPSSDNIDRVLYRVVSERFTKDTRVTWQMSSDWKQIFSIGNYKAMLFHGDEIKSFGGNTPAYGLLRKVNAWASGVVPDFHDAYGGHFHTPMTLTMANGNQIYMTGSPESDNQYAAEFVAAKGHPSQRLHFVDPEAGKVTGSYLVWLD